MNQVLHILAINMATDQKKRTWMQVVELPEMGPLLWTEDLAEATKKDHETRMPKAKPRAKPNASLIIAATEFTDAEEKSFENLRPHQKIREQKRILHNREHLANGQHRFKPFSSPDDYHLTCEVCEKKIDFSDYQAGNDITVFDWRKGKKPCLGENLAGFAASAGNNNVRKLLDAKNAKYDALNRAAWRQKPLKHIFYIVAPASMNIVKCRRPGCERNVKPGTSATFQAFNGRDTAHSGKCKGEELKEEKEKLDYQPVILS